MRRGSYSWETQDMYIRRIWYTQSRWGRKRLRVVAASALVVTALVAVAVLLIAK